MLINEPFEIIQKPNAMYFVAQNRMPWRAYFGEQPPADPDPLYMGYSVARWEGEALVIQSSGFRDVTALDDSGLPHSEQLRLTQRFRASADGRTMTVDYTIDDPADYTRPWSARAVFAPHAGQLPLPRRGLRRQAGDHGAEAAVRLQRGRSLRPIRNSSTARAHWRPSRMAQTTRDWPRRMSPQAKTRVAEVR